MSERPRVLLLFFEGLLETVIDSQVLGHARELSQHGIADFNIWSVACEESQYDRSLTRLAGAIERAQCPVRVFRGVRPSKPFSVLRNTRMLAEAIGSLTWPFTHIHSRNDYAVLVGAHLKRRNPATLIWDCRGDSAAQVDYYGREPFQSLHKAWLRRRMRAAARHCDRALFVSGPLRELASEDISGKMSEIVPCCASENSFFFEGDLRATTRAELGYGPDDLVFIYSGGLQPYQRFEDTIDAFRAFRERNARARLLLVTPDKQAALARVNGAAREIVVLSAPLSKINRLLNAADVAFLLRHDNGTNRVASPTKFAEYCLAGLPVVMTGAVVDSHTLARDFGNLVSFDEGTGEMGEIPVIDRAALAAAYRSKLGKSSFLSSYRRIYAP